MNSAFSLILIILGLGHTFSVASAFVGIQIQHTLRTTYGVPQTIGLQRMASTTPESNIPDKTMEEVWRFVKKPLISVGGKGATEKHGNSLRQLLDHHTVVKVKVNTKSFGKFGSVFAL